MSEIQDTQAQSLVEDDEINLLDLVQTVVDNLRLLVVGPLAVGVAALGISFLVTPTFTAQVSFLPPQQSQGMAASLLNSLGALGGMAGAAAGLKNPADQYVSFLKSNSIEDALIDRFKLMDRYKADYKQDARKTLEGNVKIASGKDGIITVDVDDHDPQFAADLANAHVEELTRLMGRLAVTEAQQRRQFFEQQLKGTKDKLAAAEIALGETGVNASVLKSDPTSAVAAVATLQAQVTAQEVKLGAMRGYLAESAPEFKQAMTELLNLRAQLAKQSKDGAEPKAVQGDYINRYRDFKYQETLYELFAKQFEMAKLDEAREGATIQVVDVAQPPERKAKPKKALIAIIATLASGFALLLFVFARQSLANAAKDEDSAQRMTQIRASWRRAIGRTF
ncbi:Wzz/FepE/Etk N-terminal domain-containing protein [Aquabacterium sp.]|uniref:Wzz/FepE/Etk N-terminal domain-containing protein n=1 Tax=Aquabacterium sp. TaxID=1872578 RepID=UPI003B742CA6